MRITVTLPNPDHTHIYRGSNLHVQHVDNLGDDGPHLAIFDGGRKIAFHLAGHWASYEINGTPEDQTAKADTTATITSHDGTIRHITTDGDDTTTITYDGDRWHAHTSHDGRVIPFPLTKRPRATVPFSPHEDAA